MRMLAVAAFASLLSCATARPAPAAVVAPAPPAGPAAGDAADGDPADGDAAPDEDGPYENARPEPRPDIPVGKTLTAYTGPRFVTGESFVPVADTVIADETGRVRALAKGPPPKGLPVVKLPGKLAVAGLHDAHIHVQSIGRAREGVGLLGVTSPAAAKRKVKAWAKKHHDAAAVEGRGWDQSRFPGKKWPTWQQLEGATDKPVFLERVDGHAAWVNRALLKLAGITKDTPDPAGGKILRDDKGEPTGVLIDNAVDLVAKKLPAPTPADIERWYLAGMKACADAGLVGVHLMGITVDAAKVLEKLDDQKKLPVRVFAYLLGSEDASFDFLAHLDRPPSEHLRFMGIKLFADGAMGSRGAALLAPYDDDKGNSGLLVTDPKDLAERVARVHKLGYAAAVHAIGDRANRIVLDAMKASPAPEGARDRIEHAQLVAPEDFQRFHDEHVIASMQPTHATSDMRWAEQRVGAERLKGAYAWRTMLDDKVRLAFGSDAPVESERPVLGIYAAVTRQDADGHPAGGFLPEQRLTQAETLAAFAAGAAYAVDMEQQLGALTPGMFFDVSLFSDDAAAAKDPKAWLKTRVVGTVVGGVLREVK